MFIPSHPNYSFLYDPNVVKKQIEVMVTKCPRQMTNTNKPRPNQSLCYDSSVHRTDNVDAACHPISFYFFP